MTDSREKRTIDESARMIGDMDLGTPAIRCPHLIMIGQHDYVDVETATETYELNKRVGMRPSLKIFSAEETGASPGQMDNPTLAKEFAFEWIRRQLKMG
jgi:pimeloyl-ACP methyl ester carboxylesterase